MEVILLERVENLGQMGDVVRVKDGYARNFLLPQKKALRSNKENLAYFQTQKKELEARNLKKKQEAEAVAGKMNSLKVSLVRQAAEAGQLYGSVTGWDVCNAVREAGFHIDRRQVVLDQPFKNLGTYSVTISLHPDVSQAIQVLIVRSQDDAERQMKDIPTDLIRAVEGLEEPAAVVN